MRYLIPVLVVLAFSVIGCRSHEPMVPQPGAAWSTSPVNVNIYPPKSSAVDLPPDCPSYTMPDPVAQPNQPCALSPEPVEQAPVLTAAFGSPDGADLAPLACTDGG